MVLESSGAPGEAVGQPQASAPSPGQERQSWGEVGVSVSCHWDLLPASPVPPLSLPKFPHVCSDILKLCRHQVWRNAAGLPCFLTASCLGEGVTERASISELSGCYTLMTPWLMCESQL